MLIVVIMTMMFNGLVCVDSDNSDYTKAGGAGGGAGCAGACARYYRDKLLATLQVLENKEETISVQGSSLGVAEHRIAELSQRVSEMRRELEHKTRELTQLRQYAESCRVDKSDACITAEVEEVAARAQPHDLAALGDLYRDCFYEAAKQEELIEMLRKSYMDVRLTERAQADKMTRLQRVVDTQTRSIEQCQDVVLEVESLKSEISSFLSNSNNDSGMWERGSESPDVSEELADILDQLLQLQHMLTTDCTCGLEEENASLKERNRSLECELEQVRQRNDELDGSLRRILDQQYETQIKEKERQLQEALKKLEEADTSCRGRDETCETLKRQLHQAKVMLDDKTAELKEAQCACAGKDAAIKDLRQDLDQSERVVQEGLKKISDLAQSRSQMLLESQAEITELQQRLKLAVRRCRHLEADCRDRDRSTSELQACLEEAHARGARLCEESRRVTASVRQWMRNKKHQTRDQKETIKMQEQRICELERCIAPTQKTKLTSHSVSEPSSSVSQSDETYLWCSRVRPLCRSETNAPRGSLADCVARENETASCAKCASNRQESGSEMASCSRSPVPPTRKKRQQSCHDLSCLPSTSRGSRPPLDLLSRAVPDDRWWRPAPAPAPRPGEQRELPGPAGARPCPRREGELPGPAGARPRPGGARPCGPCPDTRWSRLCVRPAPLPRRKGEHRGPGDWNRTPRARESAELLQRVKRLDAAIKDGQRRWGRHPR